MIAIVPARKGSKGILRKNMKIVDGKPLFLLALEKARAAGIESVWLSTDCEEMAGIAKANNFSVQNRLCAVDDKSTIEDVVKEFGPTLTEGEALVILQPTSPFTKVETIRKLIWLYEIGDYDSVATAKRFNKILWKHHLGSASDLMTPRVNRQELAIDSKWALETGGVLVTNFRNKELIQKKHGLWFVDEEESIDIYSLADLHEAQRKIRKKLITIAITAGTNTGSGHLKRQLLIADVLSENHDVQFRFGGGGNFGSETSDWAAKEIMSKGYDLGRNDLYCSDVVILDCLDTEAQTVKRIQGNGSKVITFEDLGSGARVSDLCINDMYSYQNDPRIFAGTKYTVLRNEFLFSPKFKVCERKFPRVLISFGGTDPANASYRIANWLIHEIPNIQITVLNGIGNSKPYPGLPHNRLTLLDSTNNIAQLMLETDLFITSAGRTVTEAAHLGVPTISIPVNYREEQHLKIPGVIRMPDVFQLLTRYDICNKVSYVLASQTLRVDMSSKSQESVDGKGLGRVIRLIEETCW